MSSCLREKLNVIISQVDEVDSSLADEARAHLDNLTKPLGSLGRLEELAVKMFVASGGKPPESDPARIYTIAGDHGVNAEDVSFFPQEVTRQMVENFLAGGAGINVLASTAGVELIVVDAGCMGGEFPDHPHLIQRKIGCGTANISLGPAMTEEQCLKAMLLGVELADESFSQGIKTLGTGEMGVSNTTPSTALFCAYFDLDPVLITGPGGGIDAEGVIRKAAVVKSALAANADVVASGDAVSILTALGGYEIAALTGLILGGAKNRQMVCIDGFISTAAYAAATRICPVADSYCVLSHASAEPGYAGVVEALGGNPLLHLDMRLGEGSGAALSMFMLRAAANIYNDMATFSDAGVDSGSSNAG
ncbi:nicotinate-nucleotide--dimethylbenzimidazole phosphoribosyltransferase [Maridesulfovibrio hydrothermalis]|uniref:Nicotinate-nucleotide--dimethylbenzimidazole phosphoribosyltransferase n=1 Tax=Maridesulfovibrio hydrothermalis AM13 = DSM 14728 TaxID=1121451 RepID=L0RAG6_9BACT|nr:nicotinate-nucleotide--dimethylbenzimidazole phosphoribosyltransferase [Maridesulfovibrio hydrothermalis]CCO22556.1 Nicotinate-nucleotide--dimethylbenzimidazole phosphoribosyltransferase [Maridesulfovibrio hydrothermalis AM13 = DSM 14728]